jgi:hypothetical protein
MSTKCRLMSIAVASAFAIVVGSAAGAQESTQQQKCINAINKDAGKVAQTQGKENAACVKAGTKAAVAANCPTADSKGKVAKATGKTTADETKNCIAPLPDFGYTSAATANSAAQAKELALLSDTYGGTDLSSVISTDKLIGGCQSTVTKDVEKIAFFFHGDYVGCKKTALKGGASAASALEACIGGDLKQKVQGAGTKLGADITKKCTGVTQATAFPGSCSAAADLGACLTAAAKCRMCQAINAEDGINANCDLVDNGAADSSCLPPPPPCAVTAAGEYTQTTTSGVLRVATFAEFPFPAGGTTVQEVSAPNGSCVHDIVIPNGGLFVPPFCVPALMATTKVTQTGCGIGKMDSNGGSDFTVDEKGDTSDAGCGVTQGVCPAAGPAPDSSGRLDVTVGNGTADTCSGGATGNAIVTIPVNTLTWVAADASCPDSDGVYNMGTDTKLAEFPQTLDLTTDAASAKFQDLDSDGCSKSGLGPVGPFTKTGACIDFTAQTVTVAGAGAVFSSGGPTYDLLFATQQAATLAQTGPNSGATCGSPPQINFTGLQTRCLVAP